MMTMDSYRVRQANDQHVGKAISTDLRQSEVTA